MKKNEYLLALGLLVLLPLCKSNSPSPYVSPSGYDHVSISNVLEASSTTERSFSLTLTNSGAQYVALDECHLFLNFGDTKVKSLEMSQPSLARNAILPPEQSCVYTLKIDKDNTAFSLPYKGLGTPDIVAFTVDSNVTSSIKQSFVKATIDDSYSSATYTQVLAQITFTNPKAISYAIGTWKIDDKVYYNYSDCFSRPATNKDQYIPAYFIGDLTNAKISLESVSFVDGYEYYNHTGGINQSTLFAPAYIAVIVVSSVFLVAGITALIIVSVHQHKKNKKHVD